MKPFSSMYLECHDARVFRDKRYSDLLSKIYHKDRNTDRVLEDNKYFIIGDKGTGKTALAEYWSNVRTDKKCTAIDFSDIDFEVFRLLIQEGHLKFVPVETVWKLLLLAIVAERVVQNEKGILGSARFKVFQELIQRFYDDRFEPEFPVALQMLSKVDAMAEAAVAGVGALKGSGSTQCSSSSQTINSPLNTLVYEFEKAFKSARVTEQHILFIDSIDIKPDSIKFDPFIKNLRAFSAAAMWVNEKVFAAMKGKHRPKIVLLMRPDIFDRLNMQNQSAKVSDNSVVLNWDTTLDSYRASEIYELCGNFLAKQSGTDILPVFAWEHYVSREIDRKYHESSYNNSFIEFLRLSWFRPRDIIRTLRICQEVSPKAKFVNKDMFDQSRKAFSDYLFGEVRDFSRFYFSDDSFSLIEDFFSEVRRNDSMGYDDLARSHQDFVRKQGLKRSIEDIDDRVKDFDSLLQVLYSANIICWREPGDHGKPIDHWAFRERTPNQLDPKVGFDCEYAVHYGLRRSMRLRQPHVSGVLNR